MAFISNKLFSITFVLVFNDLVVCQSPRLSSELPRPEQAKTQDELFRTLSKSKASVWVDTNKGNVFSTSVGSSNLERNKQPVNEPGGHSKNMLLTLLIQPDSNRPITAVPPGGRESNLKPILLLQQQQHDLSQILLEKQEKLEKMTVHLQQQVKNQYSLILDLLDHIKLFMDIIKSPDMEKLTKEGLDMIKTKLAERGHRAQEKPHSTSSSSTANAVVTSAQNKNQFKNDNLEPIGQSQPDQSAPPSLAFPSESQPLNTPNQYLDSYNQAQADISDDTNRINSAPAINNQDTLSAHIGMSPESLAHTLFLGNVSQANHNTSMYTSMNTTALNSSTSLVNPSPQTVGNTPLPSNISSGTVNNTSPSANVSPGTVVNNQMTNLTLTQGNISQPLANQNPLGLIGQLLNIRNAQEPPLLKPPSASYNTEMDGSGDSRPSVLLSKRNKLRFATKKDKPILVGSESEVTGVFRDKKA